MAMWAIPAALGALGAIAGGQQSRSSQTTERNLGPASALENQIAGMQPGQLSALEGMVNAGPGQGDVASGVQSQRDLAAMLQQYAAGGYLPSASDTAQARQYASTQFQPQQVALQQSFQDQNQRAAQLASQLGRPVNDPIIQARLAQEQMRQGAQLTAQESAMASQFAMQMPQQRLGYTAQLADVNANLASQAMSNRQALLSLGSQLQNAERNWRLSSAPVTTSQASGGGLQGIISGGLAGAGAGMGLANMFAGASGGQQQAGGLSAQAQAYNALPNYTGPSTASFAAPSVSRFTPQASAPAATGSTYTNMYPLAQQYNMPAFSQQPATPWNYQFNPTNLSGIPAYSPTPTIRPMQSGMQDLINANEKKSGVLYSW